MQRDRFRKLRLIVTLPSAAAVCNITFFLCEDFTCDSESVWNEKLSRPSLKSDLLEPNKQNPHAHQYAMQAIIYEALVVSVQIFNMSVTSRTALLIAPATHKHTHDDRHIMPYHVLTHGQVYTQMQMCLRTQMHAAAHMQAPET